MQFPRLPSLLGKKKETQAIVLCADGAARVLDTNRMRERTLAGPDGESRYVVEDWARFNLDQPLKAGPVMVYSELDAEPIGLRKATGYGPKELDLLMGGWVPSVLRRAHEPKKEAFEMRKIIVVGLVALAAGIAAYMTFF